MEHLSLVCNIFISMVFSSIQNSESEKWNSLVFLGANPKPRLDFGVSGYKTIFNCIYGIFVFYSSRFICLNSEKYFISIKFGICKFEK